MSGNYMILRYTKIRYCLLKSKEGGNKDLTEI